MDWFKVCVEVFFVDEMFVLMVGDYNIIFQCEDVKCFDVWCEDVFFCFESCVVFWWILNFGFIEVFCVCIIGVGYYLFWDYQVGVWDCDDGIWIDYFLLML